MLNDSFNIKTVAKIFLGIIGILQATFPSQQVENENTSQL